MGSKPKAPDPVATANAQAGMNRDTAISQNLINMTDTVNPYGSTSYNQTGTTSYIDASGKLVTVPKFTQTTTYSPEQQAIFDRAQAAQSNLAGIAQKQSANVAQTLNDPFSYNNQDAEKWAWDLASQRILPQQQQNTEALRTQLINQGLQEGTQAFDRAMLRNQQGNNDQLNQLALTGRQQGFNEALATRNQPLNELNALLSSSQVSNPTQYSPGTPQASVGGVDYSGLVQNNYNQAMQSHNNFIGGLFGAIGAGAGLAATASDVRLKEDIKRIGRTEGGLPIYTYRYKGEDKVQMGVMAQEVDAMQPEASGPDWNGYRTVYYSEIK